MNHCFKLIGVSTIVVLFGCQSIAQLPQLQRNVMQIDDFRLEIKWCSITPDRRAECEFEMMSLYQDKKAGLAYPKMQDNRGNEYRMNTGNQPVGGVLMVAGTPYTYRFVATNLPSYVVRVRSVVGTFVGWLPNGTKVIEKPVVFANIPEQPIAQSLPPSSLTDSMPAIAPANAIEGKSLTSNILSMSNSYWHGTIVPIVAMPENEIIRTWRRGAYLHLRNDGIVGYNWSKPNEYIYDPANKWSEDGELFTISMTGATYTFNSRDAKEPLTARINEGGAFKMSMKRKMLKQH
ncbi:MAG: hypothetical protein GKS05_07580 [Nitrospirales bacterium]|nr:hypothetical protein [Nitrospirales bacterium]